MIESQTVVETRALEICSRFRTILRFFYRLSIADYAPIHGRPQFPIITSGLPRF